MLTHTIVQTHKLHCEGSKAFWEFYDDELEVGDNGGKFVKPALSGRQLGFGRITLDGVELPENCTSLSSSYGYHELQLLRGAEQASQRLADHRAKIPEMFRASAELKRKRLSRQEQQSVKSKFATVTITIPAFCDYDGMDVVVKQSAQPNENLVVEFDVGKIERIIEFIRFRGFDASMQRGRAKPPRPGIYPVKGGSGRYTYSVKLANGAVKVRRASNLDDAIEKQQRALDVVAAGGDPFEHDEDGAEDDNDTPEGPANSGSIGGCDAGLNNADTGDDAAEACDVDTPPTESNVGHCDNRDE